MQEIRVQHELLQQQKNYIGTEYQEFVMRKTAFMDQCRAQVDDYRIDAKAYADNVYARANHNTQLQTQRMDDLQKELADQKEKRAQDFVMLCNQSDTLLNLRVNQNMADEQQTQTAEMLLDAKLQIEDLIVRLGRNVEDVKTLEVWALTGVSIYYQLFILYYDD